MRLPGRHRLTADSSGAGSPHPALRATFSRREKGVPIDWIDPAAPPSPTTPGLGEVLASAGADRRAMTTRVGAVWKARPLVPKGRPERRPSLDGLWEKGRGEGLGPHQPIADSSGDGSAQSGAPRHLLPTGRSGPPCVRVGAVPSAS